MLDPLADFAVGGHMASIRDQCGAIYMACHKPHSGPCVPNALGLKPKVVLSFGLDFRSFVFDLEKNRHLCLQTPKKSDRRRHLAGWSAPILWQPLLLPCMH